ncbi:MAG: hypothetical protein KGO82_16235 [Bacteroidota bacterium]|nr:hypothetical protein [Bacteroidota bacterium]
MNTIKINTLSLVLFLLCAGLAGFGISYLLRTNPPAFEADLVNRKPVGNLTVDRARKMVKSYGTTIAVQTGRTAGSAEDSNVTSIYFDLRSLGGYLARMAAFHHATGVRLYLARYDSTEKRTYKDTDGTTKDYDLKGYNTLVAVPTRIINGYISDIIGERKGDKVELFSILEQPVLQAQNGGVSCPPYPPSVCNKQNLLNYAKTGDLDFLKDY